MFIKFLTTERSYEFASGGYNIDAKRVRFDSGNIPAIEGGFTVINDNGIEVDYSQYKYPYERTDTYITFTSDENIYYTYLIYDEATNYITAQIVTTNTDVKNGIMQFGGRGAEYEHPEVKKLIDDDGFYIYKMYEGGVVNTTDAEKAEYMAKKEEQAFYSAKASKLKEISAACNSAITAGIDYEGQHFSFTADDQSNLSNAVQLVMTTGLGMPYHADGQNCQVYTPEQIIAIYVLEQSNLTANTTYYNQLKRYVETLGTKVEIDAIVYGVTELTGEYKETYDAMMAQAQEIVNKFINKEEGGDEMPDDGSDSGSETEGETESEVTGETTSETTETSESGSETVETTESSSETAEASEPSSETITE